MRAQRDACALSVPLASPPLTGARDIASQAGAAQEACVSVFGAIAAAAQVDVVVCQITDISAAARRASGSTVAMEIGADSADAASAITDGLSPENINSQMANVGLPGVSVLSMGVEANDAYANMTAVTLPSINGTADFLYLPVLSIFTWYF